MDGWTMFAHQHQVLNGGLTFSPISPLAPTTYPFPSVSHGQVQVSGFSDEEVE